MSGLELRRAQLDPRLVFEDPTAHFPEGEATFAISTHLGEGSGFACFLAVRPATFRCHSDEGYQEVDSELTLDLP